MPPLANSLAGSLVLFLSTTLASAAGIGGGGLTLPVLIIIFGFDFNKSVVLSLCSVLGNTLLQVVINSSLRHPQEVSRPLIYWDAILILLPAQLGGSSLGVIVANIAPETLKLLLAISILCFAVYKTYLKGLTRWRKEQETPTESYVVNESKDFNLDQQKSLLENCDIPESAAASHVQSDDNRILSVGSTGYYSDRDRVISVFSERDEFDIPAEQSCDKAISIILAETKIILPYAIFAVLGVLWILNATMHFFMGFFALCDYEHLMILLISFLLLLCFTVKGVKYVSRQQIDNPLSVLESDINWTEVSGFPPFFTFIIGIICSLLGIGGGELMGPLMLQMGLLSQVVSVTTSVLSFFVSSSSLFLYAIKDSFPPVVECIWIFSIALVGGYMGRKLSVLLTWYYNRPSITVFALVGVLMCALGLLIYDISAQAPDFSINPLCDE